MSFNHPRRTTKTTSPSLTPSSSPSESSLPIASGRDSLKTNMFLRKGATFHSPPSSAAAVASETEQPPAFRVPSLPRRSQTNLEDVVDAHKRRVALTLGDIDRGLASIDLSSSTARSSYPDEADPVPQGFLNHTVDKTDVYDPTMDDSVVAGEQASIGRRSLRPRQNRRPSRYADSGLGSSIGSATGKQAGEVIPTSLTESGVSKSLASASAITRSAAAHSSTIKSLPRLSARASNRIHEHILKPLLAKPSLKDFRPIVEDCPRRIHGKEIVCLRDLEKTLIFMAPARAKTATLYLDFCLTSIRCIQATVEYLSDREQTRPHDRPYTNGYFIDLVDQIKQYAQQVQNAKEREAKGEEIDEMDPESTDEVKLHGGFAENGRPAELVRVKKNGKAISIATGQPIDLDEDSKGAVHFKRSLSEEADDDESVLRSMARRKRSASAAELAPKRCREPGCDKEFKRPCDLTKHEKTHSRPWKCPVESCKYHKYGWPTEKEMDRHHNDKHSSAPALYECHFKPCPYRSKRESNCKQHMEKAHGWEYVRSKNNSKNRDSSLPSHGLPTPQTNNLPTPTSEANTIDTPEEEEDSDVHDPTIYDGQLDLYNSASAMNVFGSHLGYSPISEMNDSSSSDPSPFLPTMNQDQFRDPLQEPYQNFNPELDFNLYDDDLYSANMVHSLPTPNLEIFQHAFDSSYNTSGVPYSSDVMHHISPIGHGNTMLYTPPTSLGEFDEGFEDLAPNNCMVEDFQLYPSSTGGTVTSSAPSGLFGGLPINPNLADVSAQELLDFYAVSAHAATHGGNMDWTTDDGISGYRSH